MNSLPPTACGNTPASDAQTVLLSALAQAPAGKITPLSDQLTEQDFTPAGWIIYSEILQQAQTIAQADAKATLNLPIINASLNAQGALQDQDNGVRALLNEITTTPADPLFITQLVAALQQQAYRRALAVYQDTINQIDPDTTGIEESDQLLAAAIKRLRAARQRLNTTNPNQTTGGHLAVA